MLLAISELVFKMPVSFTVPTVSISISIHGCSMSFKRFFFCICVLEPNKAFRVHESEVDKQSDWSEITLSATNRNDVCV